MNEGSAPFGIQHCFLRFSIRGKTEQQSSQFLSPQLFPPGEPSSLTGCIYSAPFLLTFNPSAFLLPLKFSPSVLLAYGNTFTDFVFLLLFLFFQADFSCSVSHRLGLPRFLPLPTPSLGPTRRNWQPHRQRAARPRALIFGLARSRRAETRAAPCWRSSLSFSLQTGRPLCRHKDVSGRIIRLILFFFFHFLFFAFFIRFLSIFFFFPKHKGFHT